MASQYHGVDGDLRSLYRKGSGMTLRRLLVLIRGLPSDSWLRAELDAAAEKADSESMLEQLRARQAHYNREGGGR